MTFEEIIRGFGEKLGGELELLPDENGVVALDVDGMDLAIMNLPEVGMIALTAPVGEPPPADRMERLYKALLEANYNFAGTFGATLSINPESGAISLCRTVSAQLTDADGLFATVEGFVNVLETWRKIVEDFRGADLSPEGETQASSEPFVPDDAGGFMKV